MSNLLTGKVAIVTGGASGIGLAAAQRFVAEGGRVVIADVAQEAGEAAAASLGEAAAFQCTDVTDEASIQAAVDAAVTRFGRLDVMFNNAGSTGDGSSITEIGPAGFDKTFVLDVRSVVLGHKCAARRFKEQGTGGSIISTVSVAGLQGGWSSVSYATAKHAVVGTIRHAAKELAPFGIRTNGVAPGVIMTPLIAKAFGVPPEKADELVQYLVGRLGSKQAMGRYGSAEDVANAALFFASDLSAYVSGTVMPVDGGISSYTLSTSDEEIFAAAQEFARSLT
ncbi:SDR family NAD(P)-dependent oxidoreductase [[Pseudomonas] boreopolis]|uniref:SDR family NAD(P)-dependent oxidoreductase n=1 Tax=Xanthomonas boreopolis TaxID=86183 RepID=UPI003D55F6E7